MLYPYVLMSADDDCRLSDERIEFAFEWTERDIVAAYLWNVLHPSTGTCLAFLCAGAVAAIVGGFGRGSATALVTQAVALGGALWLLLAILDLLWLLLVRMRSDTWRRRCMGRQMLELTPTVVTWQNAIAAERMAWADVPGVSQGFGTIHICRRKLAIPLRTLPKEWPPDVLLARLRTWHQAAADRQPGLRWRYRFSLLGEAALAAMAVYALIQFHALDEALTQHQNTWNLAHGSWKSVLDYRQEHGRLPDTLTVIPAIFQRDAYGRPLVYQVRGEHFLLVSLGRDGKPDSGDQWVLAEGPAHRISATPPGSYINNCARPEADSVVSDRGLHVGCYRK